MTAPNYGNFSPTSQTAVPLFNLAMTIGNLPMMVEYSEQDPNLGPGMLPRINVRQEKIYSIGERDGVVVLSTMPIEEPS